MENENEGQRLARMQAIYDRPIVRESLRRSVIDKLTLSGAKNGASLVSDFRPMLVEMIGEKRVELLADELSQFNEEDYPDKETYKVVIADALIEFLKRNVPMEEFELMQRKQFVEKSKFTPLSEILAYGAGDGVAHIHLAPARTMSGPELINSIEKGLRELARQMQEDPKLADIYEVTGTSWIVAKKPEMLISLGFTIDGPVSDEIRERYFSDNPMDTQISRAHMIREDFIKRYGK